VGNNLFQPFWDDEGSKKVLLFARFLGELRSDRTFLAPKKEILLFEEGGFCTFEIGFQLRTAPLVFFLFHLF